MLEGKLNSRQDEYQVVVDTIRPISLDSLIAQAQKEGLYDENERIYHGPKETVDGAEAVSETSPYIIELPMTVGADMLEQLKNLLMNHKGDREVVVHIGTEPNRRRIKVPFGIKVTEGLKLKIREVLLGSSL